MSKRKYSGEEIHLKSPYHGPQAMDWVPDAEESTALSQEAFVIVHRPRYRPSQKFEGHQLESSTSEMPPSSVAATSSETETSRISWSTAIQTIPLTAKDLF
jgi:hypothetical protein